MPSDTHDEESLIEQRLIGHGDGQRHAVRDVAEFVEHLRDGYQSTAMPVGKVARLIREQFLAGILSPRPPTLSPAELRVEALLKRAYGGESIATLDYIDAVKALIAETQPLAFLASHKEIKAPELQSPACDHEFMLCAWKHHEIVGHHCRKCGALRALEAE